MHILISGVIILVAIFDRMMGQDEKKEKRISTRMLNLPFLDHPGVILSQSVH